MTEEEYLGYIFTLDICKKHLPFDAHPAHYKRIEEMKQMIDIKFKLASK